MFSNVKQVLGNIATVMAHWRATLNPPEEQPVATAPVDCEWISQGETITTEHFKTWAWRRLGPHGYNKKDYWGISARKGSGQAAELAALEDELSSLAGSWVTKSSRQMYQGSQVTRLLGVSDRIYKASRTYYPTKPGSNRGAGKA